MLRSAFARNVRWSGLSTGLQDGNLTCTVKKMSLGEEGAAMESEEVWSPLLGNVPSRVVVSTVVTSWRAKVPDARPGSAVAPVEAGAKARSAPPDAGVSRPSRRDASHRAVPNGGQLTQTSRKIDHRTKLFILWLLRE